MIWKTVYTLQLILKWNNSYLLCGIRFWFSVPPGQLSSIFVTVCCLGNTLLASPGFLRVWLPFIWATLALQRLSLLPGVRETHPINFYIWEFHTSKYLVCSKSTKKKVTIIEMFTRKITRMQIKIENFHFFHPNC